MYHSKKACRSVRGIVLKRPAHYRTKLIILLVIILGLVSMGMRLPNLLELASSSAKPKPRPRAVIKTQIKSCQELIKKFNVVASSSDGLVRSALADVSEFVGPFGVLTFIIPPTELVASNTLSRASPSHA